MESILNPNHMEYLLILILQLLGIGFHVMQKIVSLGDKFPTENRTGIFGIFMKEDWDTLVVSGLVLCLNLVVHFILSEYKPPFTQWEYYILSSFAAALLFGY